MLKEKRKREGEIHPPLAELEVRISKEKAPA
jgi:hypothetical protein